MTRGELTSAVLERFGVGSSRTAFVTQIQGHLNRIYVREVVALGLLKATTTVALTAGDEIVYLPPDFAEVDTFRLGATILVPRTSPGVMTGAAQAVIDGDSWTAGPRYYDYFPPDRLRVGPVPSDDEVTGSLVYRAKPDLMTADADVPDAIPAEYHDLLLEMAVWRMAPNQEEPGMGQDALGAAGVLREELRESLGRVAGNTSDRIRRRFYG